ncbi:MAG: BamA/TamA family outer membrane protein, partial [Reinekea sp.]|nr:BamA/TamA family outer membrane protein [Reinekea sp.]
AGNVFTDQCRDDNLSCTNGVQLDEIRYSAGVDFTWITPIAPLSFSYAWPLNAQEDDYTTNFSFNIGISY